MLLSSSAGRSALKVTVSSVRSQTEKTVLSTFTSTCASSDLEITHQVSVCASGETSAGLQLRSCLCSVLQRFSPAAPELRIRVGQSHEELVPQPQRSLPEDGGGSVVQSRRPADVKQSELSLYFMLSAHRWADRCARVNLMHNSSGAAMKCAVCIHCPQRMTDYDSKDFMNSVIATIMTNVNLLAPLLLRLKEKLNCRSDRLSGVMSISASRGC